MINKTNAKLQIIVLNSNIWYTSNKLINNTLDQDPGGQFEYLEKKLEKAEKTKAKVCIVVHIFEFINCK